MACRGMADEWYGGALCVVARKVHGGREDMHEYTYIYMYICIEREMCIHVERDGEREREREREMYVCVLLRAAIGAWAFGFQRRLAALGSSGVGQ